MHDTYVTPGAVMSDEGGAVESELRVETLTGDCTVLCVAVATARKRVIVVNERYPEALKHAKAHLAGASEGVWICAPECAGA